MARKSKMQEFSCKNCGITFEYSRPRVFCSQTCVYEDLAKRKEMSKQANSKERICQQCKKKYVIYRGKSKEKFCSNNCYHEFYGVPENIKSRIIYDYCSKKMSMRAIGAKYGFSDVSVRKVLLQAEINLRSKQSTMLYLSGSKQSFMDREKEIVNLYNSGYSINLLAHKFSSTRTSIKTLLKNTALKVDRERKTSFFLINIVTKDKNNKPVQSKKKSKTKTDSAVSKIIEHNRKAFLLPLSDEAAYWVGFLLADGYIYEKRKKLILELGMKDAEHVHKLAAFLGLPKNKYIYYIKSKNTIRLALTSPELLTQLSKLGVLPNKSFTAKAPDELSNNHHFWRGVVEGDGSVWTKNNRIVALWSASIYLINQYAKWVQSVVTPQNGKNFQIKKEKNKELYFLKLGGIHAYLLAEELYKDAKQKTSLDRKAEEARRMLNEYEIRGKLLKNIHGRSTRNRPEN